MRALARSHRQMTAFRLFPDPLQACRRWPGVHCLRGIMYVEIGINWELIASGSQVPSLVGAIASGSKAPIERAVNMKLTKKQLSVSYATQATVSVVRHIDDVANCENYRFDSRLTASPQGKVELPAHVSFCTTSRERVWSPYQAFRTPTGLEKHSQLRERHPSCNVEEGPQSVSTRDTCYVNDKAREQWRRSDGGHLR